MRQSIGYPTMLGIIITFIIITFAFLSATLSYMKGFKVNSQVTGILEKYEGYNEFSKAEISKNLNNLGYIKGTPNCKNQDGYEPAVDYSGHDICIYEQKDATVGNYFKYKIITYIYMDVPIIAQRIKLPVVSYSERIYYFNT